MPGPQGKGKQERWFRTLRSQLLTRLVTADTDSLDALNRRLWAWVEGEYHHTPHRRLEDRTPLECWALCGEHVRLPDPGLDLDALFLFEAKRRVQRDRTVSLNGVVYEVDAALVGEKVILRYDPRCSARTRGGSVACREVHRPRETPRCLCQLLRPPATPRAHVAIRYPRADAAHRTRPAPPPPR